MDILRGACLANGVSIEGKSYGELREQLGGVLVDKMLGSPTSPPSSSQPAQEGRKSKKRRAPSLWNQFVKTEKVKVREGMPSLRGHQVLAECARRWRLQKAVNTGESPLMLTETSSAGSDSSDGATEGLAAELLETSTPEEMRANMEEAGLEIDEDMAVNASRLASHMVQYI